MKYLRSMCPKVSFLKGITLSVSLGVMLSSSCFAIKPIARGKTSQSSKQSEVVHAETPQEPTAYEKRLASLPPVLAATLKINTTAEQAIIVDYYTGQVLFEKNADTIMYPSSMTKIMTALVAFEDLKQGKITLSQTLPVSEKAWKMEGSRMFLKVNTWATIDELLHGIIIQSGNDACVALAEGLAGTEEVFAARMTQRALELGCQHSSFKNASGLPDPEHFCTARDLIVISRAVINNHPEFYSYFAMTDYEYNKIKQPNRNPLLDKNIGCDGLKTGFTNAGKYGLVASMKETDSEGTEKRFILVVNGLPTQKARADESLRLATWVMKTFVSIPIAKKGQVLATMDVSAGAERTVPLSIVQDAYITVPEIARKDIQTELLYDRGVQAPIKIGQVLGKIIVKAPTLEAPIEIGLVATKDIERAGFFKRIWNSITHIFGA